MHPQSQGIRRLRQLACRRARWSLSIVATLLLSGPAMAVELDIDSHRGSVVVVDFWASWCAPCRRSIPWLNEMQAKYGERGLVVIGVNVDTDRKLAERFLAEVPVRFPIVYDADGVIAARYRLMGMPSSLVFGRDGKLVDQRIGFQVGERDQHEARLVKVLNGTH